jgi:hypothetical protein
MIARHVLRALVAPILFAAAAPLVGCVSIPPPTLRGAPIASPTTQRTPRARVAIESIRDLRPIEEHVGDTAHTKLFVFFVFGFHKSTEGNALTGDEDVSRDATGELRALASDWLATSKVARVVDSADADFGLELDVEHLYASRFRAGSVTVIASGKHHSTVAAASLDEHAIYGDVTLHARLFDRRDGTRRLVWDEHVSGYAQGNPPRDPIAETRATVQAAVGDALDTLDQRLGAVLDRLAIGPSGAPRSAHAEATQPTFVVERMSRLRDYLERVTIDTASGVVARHEIVDAPDRYASRPGDWLLSRVTSDGHWLDDDAYDRLTIALADRYDLRVLDDAAHVHFFGRRATQ